mgnify:FL=1
MDQKPTVYFIDGPNGSGKDYLIDRVVSRLESKQPPGSIKVLRATDYVIRREAATELRKYNAYDTENIKSLSIFSRHILLLEELLWIVKSGVKAVIVNRGIFSLLSYNLYKDADEESRKLYLDIYVKLLKEYQKYFDVIFINLVYKRGATSEENLRTLEKNIYGRDGAEAVKDLDIPWFCRLLRNFEHSRFELEDSGFTGSTIVIDSHDWEDVSCLIQAHMEQVK